MSCQIIFTDTAKSDLRELVFYIARQSGDNSVAVGFVRELREKCKLLESFPEIGAIPKDRILKSNGYRFLTHKEHLIFYLYDQPKKTVYIMAIFNGKRDYNRVMKRYI